MSASSSLTTQRGIRGIVMVAHGARAAGWDAPFQTVLASLRARADGVHYALSFLEHKTPATAEAVQLLVDQGCTHITLVPMLLGVGAHAREDLPVLLHAAQTAHPRVQFALACTMGEDAQILHAMQAFVSSFK
jgi:sirohydrochlorin cobaltochelatase